MKAFRYHAPVHHQCQLVTIPIAAMDFSTSHNLLHRICRLRPDSRVERVMTDAFNWLNAPPSHHGEARLLTLATAENTDFWQHTFYGFERDNGHAYLTPVSGDFSARVTVRGDYRNSMTRLV